MIISESKPKVVNSVADSSLYNDYEFLPTDYNIQYLDDTMKLISRLGDESKLRSEYKYHRNGDTHIVHIPDPNAYTINPNTNEPYEFSDWLLLFRIKETKKYKNYYFMRTGTHEHLIKDEYSLNELYNKISNWF